MAFKAVLFDLDGTLLDTLQDISDATNAALGKLGFPLHNIQTYRHFMGEGMVALAFKALPDSFRNSDTINRLSAYIVKEYSIRWAHHTQPSWHSRTAGRPHRKKRNEGGGIIHQATRICGGTGREIAMNPASYMKHYKTHILEYIL